MSIINGRQIIINQDGTIDLTYNITLTINSGVIHGFYVGQPKSDFTIGKACIDQYGNQLKVSDASSGSDYRFDVTLNQPLTVWKLCLVHSYNQRCRHDNNDTQNPGNLGMQFAPEWTDVPIDDARVQIVLPPGATTNDVKTTQNFYNSTSTVEGKLAVYWEIPVMQANEQQMLGFLFQQNTCLITHQFLPQEVVLAVLEIILTVNCFTNSCNHSHNWDCSS